MANWRYAFPGVAALGLVGSAYFGVEATVNTHDAKIAAAIGNYAVAYHEQYDATGEAELAWLCGAIGTAAAGVAVGGLLEERRNRV